MTKQIERRSLLTAIDGLLRVSQEKAALESLAQHILNGEFDAPEPEGWIDCKDQLPDSGEKVLVHYEYERGDWRITRAYYAKEKTLDQSEDFGASVYDEECDCYWLNEGWYECSPESGDEVNWSISNVTHWMPLPNPPTPEPKDEKSN